MDAAVTDPAPPPLPADDWQPLPLRAARLAAVEGAIGGLLMPGAPLAAMHALLGWPQPLLLVPSWLLFGAVAAAALAYRRLRRTRWRLDAQGLGLRRDLMWHVETHVPISRVQHLDLKRGPLERRARLATLVVHTAGTRMSAVVVGGLDAADAERLRDTLAHQVDQDADAL